MEEIIDFDSWIKNYEPPKIEYFAIYDPENYLVTGIYPGYAAHDKKNKILIDNELAEDIQNGIILMNCCLVNLETSTVEILEKNPLTKIDDILHRIINKKYSNFTEYDILITYKDSQLIFSMSNNLRTKNIRYNDEDTINFLITGYNDPHIIYETIEIKLNNLKMTDQIFQINIEEEFSIYTKRIYKNYLLEII